MNNFIFVLLSTMAVLFLYPGISMAYIGPGAGLTLISSLIGAVFAFVLALGAILFWPLRKLMKKMKKGKQQDGK